MTNAENQALFSFDPNFDLAVLCRAVDPERPPGFALKILRHLVINEGIKRAVNGCRQCFATGDFQPELQSLVGDKFNFLDGRLGFVGAVIEIRDQANFARQRAAQNLGDIIPVAFKNDPRHDRLQQHDGRNHDDQRTIVEPGWHVAFEKAVEPEVIGVHPFTSSSTNSA